MKKTLSEPDAQGVRRNIWKHPRPFLKWAGGKSALAERIVAKLPPGGRYIEPFVGSGAIFCNVSYDHYLLADKNPDLIALYKLLKRHGERFVKECRALFQPQHNTEEAFYTLRDEFNACTEPERRSVLFLYLNRHAFNGLCRYNSKGLFNVPYGRYRSPRFPEQEMQAFAHKLMKTELREADFTEVMEEAGEGDVVYCDPPYQPLSRTSSFTAYAAGGFGEREQEQLSQLAAQAAARGATVLVSNHDVDQICEWYVRDGAEISRFQVQRYISAFERGKAGELLALFAP